MMMMMVVAMVVDFGCLCSMMLMVVFNDYPSACVSEGTDMDEIRSSFRCCVFTNNEKNRWIDDELCAPKMANSMGVWRMQVVFWVFGERNLCDCCMRFTCNGTLSSMLLLFCLAIWDFLWVLLRVTISTTNTFSFLHLLSASSKKKRRTITCFHRVALALIVLQCPTFK